MIACYDLRYSPSTYDNVSFLLGAERERRRRGAPYMDVRVRPGPIGGFRDDRLPPSLAMRRIMLEEVVRPLASLLPSCRSFQTSFYDELPSAYGLGCPLYGTQLLVAAAKADLYPLRSPGLSDRGPPEMGGPYVTITMRESSYWPTRNSNPTEWMKTARVLARSYTVVVVRDFERAGEVGDPVALVADGMDGVVVDSWASRNLLWRAALYAGAQMNLFVNNGPAWMCLFMGAPCAIFKLIAPEHPCATADFFRAVGFPPGTEWPNLRPRQLVSWENDDAAHVIPAVEKLLQ